MSKNHFCIGVKDELNKDKLVTADLFSGSGIVARYLKQYAGKGDLIGVNGRLTTRSYQNTRGEKVTVTEVVADDVMLLNKAKQQQTSNQNTNLFYNAYQEQKSYAQSQLANEQYTDGTIEFDSDDLPF